MAFMDFMKKTMGKDKNPPLPPLPDMPPMPDMPSLPGNDPFAPRQAAAPTPSQFLAVPQPKPAFPPMPSPVSPQSSSSAPPFADFPDFGAANAKGDFDFQGFPQQESEPFTGELPSFGGMPITAQEAPASTDPQMPVVPPIPAQVAPIEPPAKEEYEDTSHDFDFSKIIPSQFGAGAGPAQKQSATGAMAYPQYAQDRDDEDDDKTVVNLSKGAVRDVDMSKPLFIKLQNYIQLMDDVSALQSDTKQAEVCAARSNDLHNTITGNLENMRKSVESAYKDLLRADKILFQAPQ